MCALPWDVHRVRVRPRVPCEYCRRRYSYRSNVARWRHAVSRTQAEQEWFETRHRLCIQSRFRSVAIQELRALVEYLTGSFENTPEGLQKKDQYTREVSSYGYRIVGEQIEQGHIKGKEQCCWALICLPGIFLASRTPAKIVVTYGRDNDRPSGLRCAACSTPVPMGSKFCTVCGADLTQRKPLSEGTKQCPFCAEHIQQGAKKCRFCGEFLDNLYSP